MNIAIIGGGITGLTAAYRLSKSGHKVTVLEKESFLGGLAYGFKQKNWGWHLEGAYHHLFTNDSAILGLLKELNLEDAIIIKRPVTANLVPRTFTKSDKFFAVRFPSSKHKNLQTHPIGKNSVITEKSSSSGTKKILSDEADVHQLDSPLHLLKFPPLSPVDKLRTAALLAFLKLNPFWKPLEAVTAEQVLITIGGRKAWDVIWQPLLYGKFGNYAPQVSAAWFWARIKKRTPSLVYIRGGFHTLVEGLEKAIKANGGTIHMGAIVKPVRKQKNGCMVRWSYGSKTENRHNHITIQTSDHGVFDAILLTAPTPIATKLLPNLPPYYYQSLSTIPHLFAQTLILETKRPILGETYWLNVTDTSYPFLAAVAHTNFMDKRHYGGNHLTYFGNYLPPGHPYLTMDKKRLLKEFFPHIKRLNPSMNNKQITHSFLFMAPFAQPVHQKHYSQRIPPIPTPLRGIYMANMDYVYPWDRGTNYAVELGERAAREMLRSKELRDE